MPQTRWVSTALLAGTCSLLLLSSNTGFGQAANPVLPHHATPWKAHSPRPLGAAQAQRQRQLRLAPIQLNGSSWIPLGPASLNDFGELFSGRITAIAAHPADSNTLYVAAAGGGVWKTIDGGNTWSPLTDTQATLSMGAIAIAPTDPAVIYAGTGEANNSGDSNYGLGILISHDGGATWSRSAGPAGASGSRLTASQIAVDPTNSNIAYAAMSASGNNALCCGTGIWKTVDSGASWINITPFDQSTPWTAVAIDAHNPLVLYAAVSSIFGGPFNGVYKSTNGGTSWSLLSAALMGSNTGRITLALSPSNSQVLYVAAASALPQAGLATVLRSDDGGTTFVDLTARTPVVVGGQGWYDLVLAVDPTSSSIVYLGGITIVRSTDGGIHWTDIKAGNNSPHVDNHAFAFDAIGRLLNGNDGGIFRLDDPVLPSWSDLNGDLNTIQFYGLGLHPTTPNIVIGGSQDNGTDVFDGVNWLETDGGDGGFAKISQQDGSLMYHQIPVDSFGPNFFRRSNDGGTTWVTKTAGIVVDMDTQNFNAPFVVDRTNGNRVLYGTNRVWETTDAGDNWTPIANLGVGGFDNNGRSFVDALALAPNDVNTIYAVKNANGPTVWVTTDHGATWSPHVIALANVHINAIQVDPIDSKTVYATANNFSSAGNVFVSTDGGTSWNNVSGNLPNEPVWSIQIDPSTKPQTLYVGADDGVYASTDAGASWRRFGTALPNVQAEQLELNTTLHILGVATHGRGIWEIQTPAPGKAEVKNVDSLTKDGVYGAGSLITIRVSFTTAVVVTGKPTLALNSGGVAEYTIGGGSDTLIFTYTVEPGQKSAHLDYRGVSALVLNGGTIRDLTGSPVDLTLAAPGKPGSLGANTNIVVDTNGPTVLSYSVLFGNQVFEITGKSRRILPWRITGIMVEFSKDIASADERSIDGVVATGVSGIGTNTLTWSILPRSDGVLSLLLETSGEHALRDAAGNPLSGKTVAQTIFVLLGDYTNDNVVNRGDVLGVRKAEHEPYNVFADINGDGTVNAADVELVRSRVHRILESY